MAKIIKIEENMTKQAEIELIQRIVRTLPGDSFLGQILKGMDIYCQGQIESDWAISPLETIDSQYKEIEDRKRTVELQAKALRETEKARDGYRDLRDQLVERVSKLEEEARMMDRQYRETMGAMAEERSKFQGAADKSGRQVVEFKARLYDIAEADGALRADWRKANKRIHDALRDHFQDLKQLSGEVGKMGAMLSEKIGDITDGFGTKISEH